VNDLTISQHEGGSWGFRMHRDLSSILGSLIPAACPDTPAGAALFIKPNVMQTNVEAWASFSQYLQRAPASHPLLGGLMGDTP